MKPMFENKHLRQSILAFSLALAGNVALAADGQDKVDAETTIRLMDAAEANSPLVVTQDISLPESAGVDAPGRDKAGPADRNNRGNRQQRDNRDRGDRGRSRADEARDNARDMSDDARENRENRGRSGDRPGRPDRPDRPEPPKGPPDK